MNYRHIYHAGNFADIVKHVTVVALLKKLQEKEKPLRVIDTHGGIGLYNLQDAQAQKTLEYQSGAQYIWEASTPHAALLQTYRHLLQTIPGNEQQLCFYPGSPYLIAQLLRSDDVLQVSELHPDDVEALRQSLRGLRKGKSVQVFHQDGYQSLRAFLPPKERRGLILIDPPYEKLDEWDLLISNLSEALRRFATGVYTIWYPLKDLQRVRQFYEDLRTLAHPTLIIEYTRGQISTEALTGAGLCIINPPWMIEEILTETLTEVRQLIDLSGKASVRFFHLS